MNLTKLIFVFILGSLVFLHTENLQATHVAGGSMSYRCLGNDRYEISLEFRRDCFNGAADAQFDAFASVTIFDFNNQIVEILGTGGELRIPFSVDDTLNETISSVCNIIGDDVCVQTTTYRDTVILPPRPGGYILAYQRCCRNNTLTNIVNPLNTGATYWVRITDRALQQCNNSPTFDRWPNAFICVNDTLRFNDKATDIDGDSLVYYLCTPSSGATREFPRPQPANPPPFPGVTFAPGFSENNMMGGSPISIDSKTGQIIAVPDQIGQFLIGVCVREFRNGELLSEVRRDFEYNVRVCGRNPVAFFEPDFDTRCDGLSISFENTSMSNFLPVDELQFTWFFDYPNTNFTSNETDPTFEFPAPGLYQVAMAVSDGLCVDTAFTYVGVSVLGDPTADFFYDSYDCDGETVVQLTQNGMSSQTGIEHTWIVEHNGRTDTLYGPEPSIDIGTDQLINVTYEIGTISGCSDIVSRDIEIVTIPFEAQFVDKIICMGEDVVVFKTTIPDLLVIIEPNQLIEYDGNGNYISPGFVGNQDFLVFASDGFCSDRDTVTIQADTDPTFPLSTVIQCGTDTVSLNDVGPDFYYYEWTGPGITDPQEVNPSVSLTSSAVYFVTISTSQGSLCNFIDTLQVFVSPIPQFNIVPFNQIIHCEKDSLILSLDEEFPEVTWRNGSGDIIGQGPTLELFNLTSSDTITAHVVSRDGCENSNFVAIDFIDEPVINFSTATVNRVCAGDDAFLAVTSSDSITWSDANGTVLGIGNTLTLENVIAPQIVFVTVTNEFLCEASASLLVDLFPDPTIDFTPLEDIVICPRMMIPIELITMDSVTWFDSNGNILETGPILMLNGIVGNITYVASVMNEFGCEVSDTFDIIVDPSIVPDVDISILDSINVCVDTDFFVSIESSDSITWMDLDQNILQIGNEFLVPNVTDTLTFVVSVIDEFGCELLDTFDLNTFTGIQLEISALAIDSVYCEGESIDLITDANVNAVITWYNADTIIGIGDSLLGYFPVGNVSIIGIAEDQFGCVSTDTFSIRESQTEGEIIGDSLICINETSTLSYIPELINDVFSIMWSPLEFIVEDNDLSIVVEPDTTTTFTAIYSNEDGCITQDQYVVEVTGFFLPPMAFADPEEILLSESSQLSTDQSDDYLYEWEPSESLDDASSPQPIATPSETTIYSVTITDDNGCSGIAMVTVRVVQPNCDESDVFVPNMFTPNGDMLNDVFRVESNFIDELTMLIYNRWGEEVYNSSDTNGQWDGTFKGQELPPDVFAYHIFVKCINGIEYMKQGNVTLSK